eukprot:TRINITY_DN9423_c0_g1_i4.p1 TRINITY_DN9423_c0_g1~~TRINITY_DN9423_c0_g1_i4.p1  ORF type:complete len:207 (-),score=21.86 TRINITY_DN9423_c0_g1_i4:184-804(-)
MNPHNYPPQPYPCYNCQLYPYPYPSPLFAPQNPLYYPHLFPPAFPFPGPGAAKRGEMGLQLSPTEESPRRAKSGKSRHFKLRTGPWTAHEHKLFLEAMKKYGNDWPAVVAYVGTRSAPQVRSHAQKHYKRLRKSAIAKVKRDPEKQKAVFVITQEYRHHNKVYKVSQKIEDKKGTTSGAHQQKDVEEVLNWEGGLGQSKNVEGCTQ